MMFSYTGNSKKENIEKFIVDKFNDVHLKKNSLGQQETWGFCMLYCRINRYKK